MYEILGIRRRSHKTPLAPPLVVLDVVRLVTHHAAQVLVFQHLLHITDIGQTTDTTTLPHDHLAVLDVVRLVAHHAAQVLSLQHLLHLTN